MYFGPKAPAGWVSNWEATVPGKGFCPMPRFYGLKAGLFDGDLEAAGRRKDPLGNRSG
jgi:hypothetical protein